MKKEIISILIRNGVLITESLVEDIDKNENALDDLCKDEEGIKKLISVCNSERPISSLFKTEKPADDSYPVNVIFTYERKPEKKNIQDFVTYFNNRYVALEKMLRERKEIENLTQISKVLNKKDRETVSVIGIISEIRETKNGNLFLTVEDQSDAIKVLINKTKPDLFKEGRDLVLDEVIGIKGANGDGIIFANSIIHPDVPVINKEKKLEEEVYAIFLSDIHVGSTYFLKDDFERFLRWINGEMGSPTQREIVKKIRYIFIVGDLVDGVGIYPGQDKELEIKDIYEQYAQCARLLNRIPKDKKIIICPGNHDATRLSEPQPPLAKEFVDGLDEMENVTLVSNPSVVNIHSNKDFEGFNVLLYHGYSFDYYVSEVDSIRNSGGYDRADLMMKFLLRRRHLAPTHASSLYIPDTDFDPLVIASNPKLMPDIFVTGHIHKSYVSKYKNITLISGSCWQSTTPFQEKVGHKPEPSRIPLLNLQNTEARIIRFG